MSTEKVIAEFKQKRLAELEEWGVVKLAKAAIADPGILKLDEHEFTALITRAAQKQHPGLSAAQAFSKVFCASDETGTLLRNDGPFAMSLTDQPNLVLTSSLAPF